MHVLLVTSWGTACGIAEHAAMLVDAVTHADGDVNIAPCPELDPDALPAVALRHVQILHLNYQAALHSRWTPEWIRHYQAAGKKVIVTYHDTGVPNSDQCRAIIDACDAAIVHEPFDDLPAEKTHYWRMGVVDPCPPRRLGRDPRPMLGTIGFPFGWKCYDKLCEMTAEAGWQLLLIAPGATAEDIARWSALQPNLHVICSFIERQMAVSLLGGCDATAFTYVCHNTGQSGALLLGIAARKPLLALSTCRQFRALYHDPMARLAIRWAVTFEELTRELRALPATTREDEAMLALAEQESWRQVGEKYAQLYRSLV